MFKNIKTSNKSIYKRVKLYWLQSLWQSQDIIKFKKFHLNLVNCLHRYRRHAKKINKLRYLWQKLKGVKRSVRYQLPRQFLFDFTRVYVRRKRRKYRRIFDDKKKEFVLSQFNLKISKKKRFKINILTQVKSFILRNSYNICGLIQNANFFDKLYFIKQFLYNKVFLVNGNCITDPYYILSKWDLLTVSEEFRY